MRTFQIYSRCQSLLNSGSRLRERGDVHGGTEAETSLLPAYSAHLLIVASIRLIVVDSK